MSLYKNAKGELIELNEKEAESYKKLSKLTIIGDIAKEESFKTAKVELIQSPKTKKANDEDSAKAESIGVIAEQSNI